MMKFPLTTCTSPVNKIWKCTLKNNHYVQLNKYSFSFRLCPIALFFINLICTGQLKAQQGISVTQFEIPVHEFHSDYENVLQWSARNINQLDANYNKLIWTNDKPPNSNTTQSEHQSMKA